MEQSRVTYAATFLVCRWFYRRSGISNPSGPTDRVSAKLPDCSQHGSSAVERSSIDAKSPNHSPNPNAAKGFTSRPVNTRKTQNPTDLSHSIANRNCRNFAGYLFDPPILYVSSKRDRISSRDLPLPATAYHHNAESKLHQKRCNPVRTSANSLVLNILRSKPFVINRLPDPLPKSSPL